MHDEMVNELICGMYDMRYTCSGARERKRASEMQNPSSNITFMSRYFGITSRMHPLAKGEGRER